MYVIYISYDGMTDALGQSQVIPYLIGLSQNGHHFTIVSSEKNDRFSKDGNRIKSLLSQYNIDWHPLPYSDSSSVFSKRKNVKLLRKEVLMLCKKKLPDAIHCRSYMAALIGLEMKKKFGTKFIFDMRGFWADERLDGKIWDLKKTHHKLLYNYFKRKEIAFLKSADYTISLTQNAKNEILSWPAINKSTPIEVIPCCVDLKLFSPKNIIEESREQLRNSLGISATDFVLSYLGSIGTWYMLNEMLDFFKVFSAQNTSAKFLIITPDDDDEIKRVANEKQISLDKIIICSAKRDEVPIYLSLSNIALYFIKPFYSKKASSPTKTGEIMAMGIPIITNAGIGDSDQLITASGTGMLVNEFSNDEYVRVINKIDVFLSVEREKIRQVANDYYSLEKGVALYNRVYEKIN